MPPWRTSAGEHPADGVTIIERMSRSGSEDHAAACGAIRKIIYEFLDAELSARESARVEAHIAICHLCAGHVAFERAFLAVVRRRATVDQSPPDLSDRIRAALARMEDQRRRR